MKVIPVVDVLGGIVVNAAGGRRNEYQPLNSVLCKSTDPVKVAAALKTLEFDELYVADLDAIIHGSQNSSLYKNLVAETGLELMVDAGVTSIKAAQEMFESGVSKVIIGTETLLRTSFVADAIESFRSEKIMVSLDLMGGKVLGKFKYSKLVRPLALLHRFQEMGVSQIIVLDLTKVGSRKGVNKLFLKDIIRETEIDVYVGGGVRDTKELLEMKDLGVIGVLIATALHSGDISPKKLKQVELL